MFLIVPLVTGVSAPCAAENLSFSTAAYLSLDELSGALGQTARQEHFHVNRAPEYALHSFVIQGKSAADCAEATEMLDTRRARGIKTAQD